MNEVYFIILSVLYITALAAVDGLFNRLVFGNKRKLSYFSKEKQRIYKQWEWRVIGIIFLIILPIVLPSLAAYLFGGLKYVTLYWIIVLLVPWDVVFGALVFDDWFGDSPSIALPILGWMNFPLLNVMIVRLLLAVVLVILKIKFGI